MASGAVLQRRSVGHRLAGLFQGRRRLQVGALLAGPVGTAPLAGFPLSLIPTFLVPLAVMLHLITLRQVLGPARVESERLDAPRTATAG